MSKKTGHKSTTAIVIQKKAETPFFDHHSEQEQPFFASNESVGSEAFFSPSRPLSNGSHIQAKLTVGQPNDKFEQEADSVADKVVQRLSKSSTADDSSVANGKSDINIQRKCADCEAEEETVQRKPSNTEGVASTNIESQLNSSKGGGSPLPDNTRTSMESAMGADFSNVRVHTGSNAVQMSQDLNAQAFTHGSDVYFNAGKYNPSGTEGGRLLAHELVHTVQQRNLLSTKIMRVPTEEDIRNSRATYSSSCGWIDWTHAESGFAIQLLAAVRTASESIQTNDEGEPQPQPINLPSMESTQMGITFTSVNGRVFLRRRLNESEVRRVALRLLMLQSNEFEEMQSWTDMLKSSSFSEEDLPSNVIGFYRAAMSYSRSDIARLCRSMDMAASLSHFEGYIFTTNRTFLPFGDRAALWPRELTTILPADFPGPLLVNGILHSHSLLSLGGGGDSPFRDNASTKIEQIRNLLNGWTSETDISSILRILRSVRNVAEMRRIRAVIEPLLIDGLSDIGDRTMVRVGLLRLGE